MLYLDWTYLLIIPGLLLGLWAQHKVKSTYQEYSRVRTRLGKPASTVVADLLRRNGNYEVSVGRVAGELTDHYNPGNETLNLSDGVYGRRQRDTQPLRWRVRQRFRGCPGHRRP